LRAAADGMSADGVLIAAFEYNSQIANIERLGLPGSACSLPYAIVGRHPQAHLKLWCDPSVALRHLFVRLIPGIGGRPELDVRDLRTDQGFSVEGLGPASSIRSSGHLFLRMGSATVMLLPRWTWPDPWPSDAATAWQNLPRLCVDNHVQHSPVAQKPVQAPIERGNITIVTCVPPLIDLAKKSRELPVGERFGTLTLAADCCGSVVKYDVSREDLATGVLVGRYSRCQFGEQLSHLLNWSRVHVIVTADDQVVKVYDTASTPGTVIDARHINYSVLGDRAVMALGRHVQLVWERTGAPMPHLSRKKKRKGRRRRR
jgi:hypothetical protein